MDEELNNFNTDMKELFINNKIDEIKEHLSLKSDDEVKELTFTNYDVVKKYYDAQKFDLLFAHMTYVAYCCFFCEYAKERGILNHDEQHTMMGVFIAIYELMQAQKQA